MVLCSPCSVGLEKNTPTRRPPFSILHDDLHGATGANAQCAGALREDQALRRLPRVVVGGRELADKRDAPRVQPRHGARLLGPGEVQPGA
eukprot:scaffold353_cov139-Isochrysis_galbana.AAC.2